MCARHEAVLDYRMYKVLSMPVNWDIMMENTMDPSHANWLHDGFAGKWEDSVPMKMCVTQAPSDPNQVRCLKSVPNCACCISRSRLIAHR